MTSLAVLHASQLVTLSGPKRPRVGTELSALGIIRDGGMLIRDGRSRESVRPMRSKRMLAMQKLSMPVDAS